MKRLALALAMLLPFSVHAMETAARHAYMVDADTGTVLLNKEADVPMPPSSMSKLMTAYMVFSQLEAGKLELDQAVTISKNAWEKQGSKMFVHVGDAVRVEDLLRGMIIQSGNDACVALAEHIAGDEASFAQMLNAKAKELGLTGSHFVNATGWPDEGHVMTARDLATLAKRLMTDFPKYYHYYSEREFTYNNITQPNRNRLLGAGIGVDGLKTGHTEIGGYGITLSAKDPETARRVILVINGLESDDARVEEGNKLLTWGLKAFQNKPILKAGEVVAHVPVWFGTRKEVGVSVAQDTSITLLKEAKIESSKVTFEGPIPAPIKQGDVIATLELSVAGQAPITVPLVATDAAEELTGIKKWWRVFWYKLLG